MIKAVEWNDGSIRMIDQTLLPHREVYLDLSDYREIAGAITGMKVRGAPAIGITAAYGLALAAREIEADSKEELLRELKPVTDLLASTRPTAVNLFWALERLNRVAEEGDSADEIKTSLIAEARAIEKEAEESEKLLSRHGAAFIEDGFNVLTHCNTGALACGGYGTALGIIKTAWRDGKQIHVFADETRPLLQGARLTAWELQKEGIPCTIITDSMAGHFMSRGEVDAIFVGADRIAANGDTANKIGTYSLAVLAKENGVPFYVAAPASTVDLSLASGDLIPIEERAPGEVLSIGETLMAPEGSTAANPAFDITPNVYISAIFTESGVAVKPFEDSLGGLTAD